MSEQHAVHIRTDGLRIEDVVAVARHAARVSSLDGPVRRRMDDSRTWLRQALEDEAVIYGVSTGFGRFATKHIPAEDRALLSRNVILNCMAGVGPDLPLDVVRAIMLVRANALARGHSGVRPELVETLIEMLNRGVTPRVPSKGSLGASGDLAPLSHIAAVVARGPSSMKEDDSGEAWYGGELLSGAEAMRRAGIERPETEPKEGLALTNGTSLMVAIGVLAVHDAERLLRHAEIAAGMSMEAVLALSGALDPALHEANGQPGQMRVAANLKTILAGSELIDSDPDRVQDAYSLRCTPQVLGPIHDTLDFLGGRFESALNAAADNPLIFVSDPDGEARIVSGGNFHGQGPALWLDVLGIAVAQAATISERRTFRLLTPELSGGLPAMLVASSPGLNGGLMVGQYTAAALVSENKTLAHPASVDSIPTSANQEDHVSMGGNAALHAMQIVRNVRTVLAIELLTAAQAIDLRPDGPQRLGRGSAAAYAAIRERVTRVEVDRPLAPDIAAMEQLIDDGTLLARVANTAGTSGVDES
jgi:histidine ammonia-lyase